MRRPYPHLLACAAAVLLGFVYVDAAARDVLVITDQQHPVTATADTRIVLLDAPARLKAELSADLPAEVERASRIVRQRLAAGGSELQQRFQQAYQGVAEAWRLGVTKIPAVVVDGRYVIYGDTNVEAAVARIQTYRRSHP